MYLFRVLLLKSPKHIITKSGIMRQKRAKAYKRLMSLYSQTFGFRQPFQVLGEQELISIQAASVVLADMPIRFDFLSCT